jgi:hypothetical protein
LGSQLLATFAILSGCGDPGPVDTLIVAVDLSDQSEQRLLDYATTLFHMQRGLDSNDRLIVITFWNETNVLYEGPGISGRNSFNKQIASHFANPRERMRQPGTRTELAFQSVANVLDSCQGSISIAILTDGGVEDQSQGSMEVLRRSVERFAAEPRVRIVGAFGVHPWFREVWQEWLRPLGSRGMVRGTNDMRAAAGQLAASESSIVTTNGGQQ